MVGCMRRVFNVQEMFSSISLSFFVALPGIQGQRMGGRDSVDEVL